MIKINSKITFSYNRPPLVIAEISGNHNQSKRKFLKLVDSAFKNGADLVKIQTYEPIDITLKTKDKNFLIKKGLWKKKYLWDLYKKAHTPFKWHRDAFKVASKNKGILFSSPFSKRAVDLLESFNVKLYKIASFEAHDIELVKYIAATKKPVIASTGMLNEKETYNLVNAIEKFGCGNYMILHCVSAYPCNHSEYNLNLIRDMQDKFSCLVGLSDHTIGNVTAVTSIALGVSLIEKHYTLDRNGGGPDDSFSMLP